MTTDTPSGRTCDADIIERCGPTDWERYRCGAPIECIDCGEPPTSPISRYCRFVCTGEGKHLA